MSACFNMSWGRVPLGPGGVRPRMLLWPHRAQESLICQPVLSWGNRGGHQSVCVCSLYSSPLSVCALACVHMHLCMCVPVCAHARACAGEGTQGLPYTGKHRHTIEPHPVPSSTCIWDQSGRQRRKGCGTQTFTSALDFHT